MSTGADDGQHLVAEWLLIDAYCVVAPGQLPSARKTAPEVSGPLSRDPYIRFVTTATTVPREICSLQSSARQ